MGGRWIKFAYLEASGTRGGIMMMSHCRAWKGEVLEIGDYTLTCKFEAQFQSFSCHLTGVYAPNCYIERRKVWEEIADVRGLMEGPWAICGDFNTIRYVSEKRNCNRRSRGMIEFSDFIEDMNLIDLQLQDGNYTWFKGDNHDTTSRFDRFLLSEEWDDCFSNIKQSPLQRLASDHIPLALQGGSWIKKKNYFKFENWWLGTAGFNDRIKEGWNSFSFKGWPDFVLSCKLKALKHKLKDWSRSEAGNLVIQRKQTLEQLAEMDLILEYRPLTEEESAKKVDLTLELEGLIKNEEVAWRQKSRALWLKEGDRNTKFFHKVANAHKRFNYIDQLMVQGELTEESTRIESAIIDFYQKLYSETTH
ncbi:hypothetical protein MTR67_035215 [Solanum verrucosum]|uniref:Endonuclease/exonuclease/phosphatase domain-containing protein n=1 Tax=Solanum verrucosum TaxID=315347 RepID=A0AAF0U9G7_SOLVR|nr:hypothetical protein MTR67_035215 [Solanum verrucosum]